MPLLLLIMLIGVGCSPALAQSAQPDGEGPAGFTRWSGPLTLEQSLVIALEHGLEVALGKTQAAMLTAEAREAEGASRLKVAVGAYLTVGSTPMIFSAAPRVEPNYLTRIPDPGGLNLNLMAMFPLFTGGLLEHRLAAAQEAEKAGLARAALALRTTAREVRRAYYQVLQVRARLVAAQWELGQRREMLRLAELRLKLGRVARYVVLRTQAEVAATQQKVNTARAEEVEAGTRLAVLMGVAATSEFSYPEKLEPPPAEGSQEESLRLGLAERPDLVAARHAVQEGDWRLAAALAEYSPQGYLVGMAEAMKSYRSNPLDAGYQVGLVVSWPLYDGGEREAREERAVASRRLAAEELRRLELQVTGEVLAARARLQAARANAELAGVEVESSGEELRIARMRYELGQGLHLEVLDALASAARARADRLKADYELNLAYAELLYATGRY